MGSRAVKPWEKFFFCFTREKVNLKLYQMFNSQSVTVYFSKCCSETLRVREEVDKSWRWGESWGQEKGSLNWAICRKQWLWLVAVILTSVMRGCWFPFCSQLLICNVHEIFHILSVHFKMGTTLHVHIHTHTHTRTEVFSEKEQNAKVKGLTAVKPFSRHKPSLCVCACVSSGTGKKHKDSRASTWPGYER